MNAGLAASVHARLLARTKERGEDFNLTLTRYAVERFLYRLSISDLRDRFWLKGALLFDLWFDVSHRPTRDADLLGLGPQDAEALGDAVAATFARRGTALQNEIPLGLSDEFAEGASKLAQNVMRSTDAGAPA